MSIMGQIEEGKKNFKRKYVVWGTGITAAEFSYHNKNEYLIDFYVDNYTGRGMGESFVERKCSTFVK